MIEERLAKNLANVRIDHDGGTQYLWRRTVNGRPYGYNVGFSYEEMQHNRSMVAYGLRVHRRRFREIIEELRGAH